MLATTLIHLSGLALCMVSSAAVGARAEPHCRWPTPATTPMAPR